MVQWIEKPGRLLQARFDSLAAAGVPHAIFSRLGGVSQAPFDSLNTGATVGDDPAAVHANLQRIYSDLGVAGAHVVTGNLVHGTAVAVVGPEHRGQAMPRTDGLVTRSPGVVLFLRFADCVPLLFFDRRSRAVGLAHAGWKGTLQGIGPATVRTMAQTFGSQAADLLVGIGPSIGPCCYEVGRDVADQARQSLGPLAPQALHASNGRLVLDLWEANRLQLAAMGVEAIEVASACTACQRHTFFSHRGDSGRTGRFGVALWMPTDSERGNGHG
ncbi:MAG: peptidoglycan editing factor PgeF [Chloroflexi bacterium]|nr:peptidoglycan editing factor PgeF [Chloroflexota bacterium]